MSSEVPELRNSKLNWCTEEIPIGSKYFLTFEQSFTEPRFLGSLQREGSWIGALPLIRKDTFDISRLQYLVPTLRYHTITTSDPSQIEQSLLTFSQYLLQPRHAFIHVLTNFDFCDQSEYIPLSNHTNYANLTRSLPLFTGSMVNKALIALLSQIIEKDSLSSLQICEDIARTGIGLRCLYPKQYSSIQKRFVVRASVDFGYPGQYRLDTNEVSLLLFDSEWLDYVDRVQTQLIDKAMMPSQTQKLWKPLLIDASVSDSESESEYGMSECKMRKVSETKQSSKPKYLSPFLIYDFSQNRYSSNDRNMSDIISAITHSATEALKCANMQREFDSKISKAHVFMVLSLSEYESKPKAYVYRLNILKTQDLNGYIRGLNEQKSDSESIESVPKLITHIIGHNIDEFHKEILVSKYCTAQNFVDTTVEILQFLKIKNEKNEKRTNILLLQERAIIILADVIWHFYKRFYAQFLQWIETQNISAIVCEYVSHKRENITQICAQMRALIKTEPTDSDDDLRQYYTFLEPFLKASNEKELQDFNECAQTLLAKHRKITKKSKHLRYKNLNICYETQSGMRVGISSANASDNWSNSKLSGGVTVNMSINLDSIGATPVSAKVSVVPNSKVIRLSTTHTMYGGSVTTESVTFDSGNIHQFLSKIADNKDVFRMLKYALVFVGIVKDPHSQRKDTDFHSILTDIGEFTRGNGLSLSVTNLGPSRSGFASSSAVAMNILKVLYHCADLEYIAGNQELLGSMALLLENRLGLKSGRQDVDGLLPHGVKVLQYGETTEFVTPKIAYLPRLKVTAMHRHLILVNSGIARASGLGLHRGLNMRFLAYLCRDPIRYKPILQSYVIHSQIIDALQRNNYCLLGKLFSDYMHCRERIDPGATQSKYDCANQKVLPRLFDALVGQGLIFGGMFTGAMGGGVAMLCLTERGMTDIDCALQQLKQWKTDKGSVPFARLSKIAYSVNVNGIKLSETENQAMNTINIYSKKEYLFKAMTAESILCLDHNFAEIVLPINDSDFGIIQKIREITHKAEIDRKDVNIVVIETYNPQNQKMTCKVSYAKVLT